MADKRWEDIEKEINDFYQYFVEKDKKLLDKNQTIFDWSLFFEEITELIKKNKNLDLTRPRSKTMVNLMKYGAMKVHKLLESVVSYNDENKKVTFSIEPADKKNIDSWMLPFLKTDEKTGNEEIKTRLYKFSTTFLDIMGMYSRRALSDKVDKEYRIANYANIMDDSSANLNAFMEGGSKTSNIASKNVVELKNIAKKKHIIGYSKMRKSDLIESILNFKTKGYK